MTVLSHHKFYRTARIAQRRWNRAHPVGPQATIYEYKIAGRGRTGRYKVEVRGRRPLD